MTNFCIGRRKFIRYFFLTLFIISTYVFLYYDPNPSKTNFQTVQQKRSKSDFNPKLIVLPKEDIEQKRTPSKRSRGTYEEHDLGPETSTVALTTERVTTERMTTERVTTESLTTSTETMTTHQTEAEITTQQSEKQSTLNEQETSTNLPQETYSTELIPDNDRPHYPNIYEKHPQIIHKAIVEMNFENKIYNKKFLQKLNNDQESSSSNPTSTDDYRVVPD